MKNLISLTLILTLLGPGQPARADFLSPSNSCVWEMRSRAPFTAAELETAKYSTNITDGLSLRFLGTVKGQHGGSRHVLRRIEDTWASNWQVVERAPLGDVRGLPIILGADGAEFFSFLAYDEKTIAVPDVHEFNAALDKLNGRLAAKGFRPVRLRFTPAPPKAENGYKFFIEFADGFRLPMSVAGLMAVHDLSFHAASIFFEDFLTVVQKSAQRVHEFIVFAKAHLHEYPEFAGYLEQRYILDLDAHTGDLVFVAYHIATGRMDMAADEMKSLLDGMFLGGKARDIDEALSLFVISMLHKERNHPKFTEAKKNSTLALLQRFKAERPLMAGQSIVLDAELMVDQASRRIEQFKMALARP